MDAKNRVTKKGFIKELNNSLTDDYTFDEIREKYGYLFKREQFLINAYSTKRLGEVLERKDSELLNDLYNKYLGI